MAIDVIILAAGQGTRMKSALPKVLHPLGGKPLLAHVIDTVNHLDGAQITIVVGHQAEAIKDNFTDNNINWAEQTDQLGTAHAVAQALPYLRNNSQALIVYGDVPLIELETLTALVDSVNESALRLLTAQLANPTGYGRIVRADNDDGDGEVVAIVEQKDATPEQLEISEINTGVMCLPSESLKSWIPEIKSDNVQKEYYLTDIIAVAKAHGHRIITSQPRSLNEVEGVNTRLQLAKLERAYQAQIANRLMDAGVSLADPQRFDCRGDLKVGTDVFIDLNCLFEGNVCLGNGVRIGPNCVIANANIGNDVAIKANTVIEGSTSKGLVTVGDRVQIGPFARLREGTTLAEDVRIGNFVETKKALLGSASKANHLSYLGDAQIGEGVNIGAGTITCNYDGVNKHQTKIDDGAFIGSNTSLVAPVSIGGGATIGAGSTICKAVPADNLSVGRGIQRNIKGWARPVKKKQD
ncbi:MAG: UDP-N-acetylglucosamine diphosphorylase/glucosamine-1-phosphate N-acetyltransferase [Gammaproteobacteria bacterium]|nr:MAG: UDP-N-acetylglucosamine diphosphorylase/glucosamine-1-phosphate N-acetyltransferase [Gammaproteobacteria bacterium]RLA54249.1 MAG: UDP-N-acetylglucosamine diphosphorylase/glucosamine-1-phosphate N-acetyltransferase [Gammaproteobacteria bacterium]